MHRKFGNITQVAATTTAVVTVGSAKTVYVRALEIHGLDASTTASNTGSCCSQQWWKRRNKKASSTTRIARLGISTEDTYFFENAYPITLTANGDSIQIYNENANDAVNVLVLGDKEG